MLSKEEARAVLRFLPLPYQLIGQLLYGSGLRLSEGVRLCVKDLDFAQALIVIRDGKGAQDRIPMLPETLIAPLQEHLVLTKRRHDADLAMGFGQVYFPTALDRKFTRASRDWVWQYVFPSNRLSTDPRANITRRHHVSRSTLQKGVRKAAHQAKIQMLVSCHTVRHSFATHLLENGYDACTVQELLGHKDVRTTMIDTHVLNRGGLAIRSPLDAP